MGRDDDELELDGDPEAWSLLSAALPPRLPPPELRARLLTTLRGPERFAPFVDGVARTFELEAPAVRAAFARIDDGVWQRGFVPGSSLLVLPALLGANTILSRLPARGQIGPHPHLQREITFVLEGQLIDHAQARFGPGDVCDMLPGSTHSLEVADDHECLVVFSLRAPPSNG